MNDLSARAFPPARKERSAEAPKAKEARPFWSKAPTVKARVVDDVGAPAISGMEATMLRSEVTGHRPGASLWRVILAGVREPHGRVREQEWKESKEGELSLDRRGRMHAFDEMRHWRDPAQRLRTIRCRRHTLIDDNPCSG
jgi:hypothetical protein